MVETNQEIIFEDENRFFFEFKPDKKLFFKKAAFVTNNELPL